MAIVGGIGRDGDVRDAATRVVRRYLSGPDGAAAPEFLDVYIGLAALTGDAQLYDKYVARVQPPSGRDRYRFLYALAAWQAIKTHWDALQAGVGALGGTTRIIEALSAFCTRQAAADIRTFFATHPIAGASRALAQTLDDIDACAALAEKQRAELATALSR